MWTDRVLDPGSDRSAWERARWYVIGASDVKNFARIESVPKYFRAKIGARSFKGNAYTARGHEFEDTLIAATGIPGSGALIHSPDERGFAATPDGITPDGKHLAEAKLRHERIASGPSNGEWRQLAWQFACVPEAEQVTFVEGEVMPTQAGWRLRRDPQLMVVDRDDPKIQAAIELVRPIAVEVLALLREHELLEKAFLDE